MEKFRPILLAEDNPRDIELTLEALKEHHLANRVVVVHDGVEVLDYLKREGQYADRPPENPVVILLDIKMPRMDGLEALREIKQDPKLKLIPVVMLTTSRESPDLISSYELGVNAYVVKPVDFLQFADVIKQLAVFWALLNETPSP
jgi:CheY-like chemotaxis protein